MEIIVVTSLELLEAVQNLIPKPYDFGNFERTAEYTKLAEDKNWLGEYDRAKRGINKNHWSFWLKKDQIHFILIDPFAPPEWRMNSFVHEIAHMSWNSMISSIAKSGLPVEVRYVSAICVA